MHIAFDGGAFQQGILGGIYQVSCGFLNSAKRLDPNFQVTLVADPRQGQIREEAIKGLSWRPAVKYAPVARSYDVPEPWPTTDDPCVRFFVDDRIAPAVLGKGAAIYSGPRPRKRFALLSRAGVAPESASDAVADRRLRGVRIDRILIRTKSGERLIDGRDRRLFNGFFTDREFQRWTDGAGFIPLGLFPAGEDEVSVEVFYEPLARYELRPGAGANAVFRAHHARNDLARDLLLEKLSAELRDAGCQVYFGNHFTPTHIPGLINVAWAYDMIPVLFPQYFHADARLNFDENLKMFKQSDRVYAISECTRSDVISELHLDPGKVIAAGIAADPGFTPRGSAEVAKTIKPWGLSDQGYILAVATVEPRKNHLRMIQAYAVLREKSVNCPDIVFVGKMGWNFQEFLTYREQNGLYHCAKVLSDLSTDQVACLYSGALFSTYLSVYEGFGLPVLEAMLCGCPVLTSDRSSMAEVAGNAAMLVDPYDIDAMADAFQRMATDGHLRDRLAKEGERRASVYTWDRSSRLILEDLAILAGRAT
jgi:glycosyltransferase involved in cell wall biosynthesis